MIEKSSVARCRSRLVGLLRGSGSSGELFRVILRLRELGDMDFVYSLYEKNKRKIRRRGI
jgi:hypothetical protein